MIKTSTGDYFSMIGLHYKLITTFEGNDNYTYRGIKLKVDSNTGDTILEYEVVEKSITNNNEYTDSYRSSEFFNQQPRLLKVRG